MKIEYMYLFVSYSLFLFKKGEGGKKFVIKIWKIICWKFLGHFSTGILEGSGRHIFYSHVFKLFRQVLEMCHHLMLKIPSWDASLPMTKHKKLEKKNYAGLANIENVTLSYAWNLYSDAFLMPCLLCIWHFLSIHICM